MLLLADRAGGKTVGMDHFVNKELRDAPAAFRACQFIITGFCNNFWYKCIGVLGTEIGAAVCKGIYYIVVVEILGKMAVSLSPVME